MKPEIHTKKYRKQIVNETIEKKRTLKRKIYSELIKPKFYKNKIQNNTYIQ